MSRDRHFRNRATLPPTCPMEVTLAIVRTPARVETQRPVSALWAPAPVCMDVTSADRALAAYVVARADSRDVRATTVTGASVTGSPIPEVRDPGDLRERFSAVRALGYTLCLSPIVAVVAAAVRIITR